MNILNHFTNLSIFSLLWAIGLTSLAVFVWHEILSRSRRKGLTFFFWLIFCITLAFAFVWIVFFQDITTKGLLQFFTPNSSHNAELNIYFSYSLFFSLFIIGMIIEFGKNIIVRFLGKSFFETVDDVVDLSFATALGFTAMENFLHFYNLFFLIDTYQTPISILKEVISQVFFVIPIHLFCSGIFGYYYALSLFALPEKRKFWKKLYGFIQFIKGTIISLTIYGLFFYIQKQDYTMQDIAHIFGFENFPLNESLFPFISFIFSSLTALYLFEKLGDSAFITETKSEKLKREEKEATDKHEQKGSK
ncbi:TPA: PrsW family intramembrane metalloprotease [Candidatus Gracilibacteria bacterium]|nr:PrsW family intramembrane metalloprotease [Candidatus Gracilibacteria bacterium]